MGCAIYSLRMTSANLIIVYGHSEYWRPARLRIMTMGGRQTYYSPHTEPLKQLHVSAEASASWIRYAWPPDNGRALRHNAHSLRDNAVVQYTGIG